MTGAINPLLEDDEDDYVGGDNPLLDDDDEAQPSESAGQEASLAVARSSSGVRGRGGSRPRVTPSDAALIAHSAKFIMLTPKIARMLLAAQPTAYMNADEPRLVSERTVRDRLNKLVKRGLLTSWEITGLEVIYGATPIGVSAAQREGYLLRDGEVARKKITGYRGLDDLNHDLAISHVAAQYKSPAGWQDGDKRRRPVPQDELVSEYEITRAQKITENELPKGTRFGEWREREFAAAVRSAEEGTIQWNELMETNPAFWCLGLAQNVPNRGFVQNMKVPDLVVTREATRGGRASGSYAVEVELTKKSKSAYERILRTYAIGFNKPYDFAALIYKTNNKQVINLITRANRENGFGLIESGKLRFEPILEDDGVTLAQFAKRMKGKGA